MFILRIQLSRDFCNSLNILIEYVNISVFNDLLKKKKIFIFFIIIQKRMVTQYYVIILITNNCYTNFLFSHKKC